MRIQKMINVGALAMAMLLCMLCAGADAKDQAAAKEVSSEKSAKTVKAPPSKASAQKTPPAALAGMSGAEDVTAGSVGSGSILSSLLNESFQTDLATGSATASISIVVPPGRKNMQPSLGLSYSSNNSNGVCGVGWGLATSSIQRSTKRGIPKYDNTDTFVFASSGSSGDLALIDPANNEYRQKIETGFMKYIFDSANSEWKVWDKAGTKYIFGSSSDSRIVSGDSSKTFAWFLDRVEDVYGNTVAFTYEKDGGQIYLSKTNYTSNTSVTPALTADKEVSFIYETGRPDITYNYRSGWKIETAKRLQEVRVEVDGALAWRYVFGYEISGDTKRSLLAQVTLYDAAGNSLPPKKFTYQTIE